MKGFKIVICFKWELTEIGLFKELKARGYKVESALRFNKVSIKEYLEKNPDVDAVILKEYLDGGGKWSAKELAELADMTDTNFVVVCSKAHKSRDYVKELYAAGITSAIFSDGRFGVKPSVLADLAIKKRTRKEAREYYGLKDTVIQHGVLSYEDYVDYMHYMTDTSLGLNIVDRFVTLASWLYPMQMGAFIDQMPDELMQILIKYKEFFKIYNKLKARGYVELKLKAPKNLKSGISRDKLKEKYKDDSIRDDSGSKVELSPVVIEREDFSQKIADDVDDEDKEEYERELPDDPYDDDIYDAARREEELEERKLLLREKRLAGRKERRKKRFGKVLAEEADTEYVEQPVDDDYDAADEYVDDEDRVDGYDEGAVTGSHIGKEDLDIIARFQKL